MRKWTYLVATLLMAGTTATFTGCIDTDEPEGIVDLRGAKSELIKAQAAVKLVEVEWQKAQVAYQELVNKSKELDNQYKEYDVQMHALDVKLKELEVERAQAATEQAKAEAEAKIAEANRDKAYWENKMAEEAEIFKAAMLNYQTQTAQAQEAYDNAMKLIEAGKLLLSDGEKAIIDKAQQRLYVASASLNQYYNALKTAQDNYYDALVNPNLPTLASLQAELKLAQIAVEKAEILLDEKNNMLALAEDFDAAAWDDKILDLKKKKSEYESEKSKADVEIATIKTSANYKAAEQKVAEKIKARKAAKEAYDKAVADSTTQVNTQLDIAAYKSEPINEGLKTLFSSSNDFTSLDGYTVSTGVFDYQAVQYTQTEYNADLKIEDVTARTSQASLTLMKVNAWIDALGKYSVDENGVEWNKLTLAEKEKAAKDAKEKFEKDKANWEISAKAVKGTATTVPTTDLKKVTDAYNSSYAAVESAVKAYNSAWDAVYQAAYDAAVEKEKASVLEKTYRDNMITALSPTSKAAWEALTPAEQTTSKLEAILDDTVKQAKAKADANATLAEWLKLDQTVADLAAKGEAAGNQALADDKDKKVEKAKAALVEAAGKAATAVAKVAPAISTYSALAANPYGQILANTVSVEDMTGKDAFYKEEEKDGKKTGHMQALRSDISADEFTKLSATKLDRNTAEDALEYTSDATFGTVIPGEDRLVEVTEAMVRAYIKQNNSAVLTDFGTLGAMMAANDDVQTCKDMIAAADLIKPLKAQMEGVLADLNAEINTNTALMDPFIAKADETRIALKTAKEEVKKAQEEQDALTAEAEANSKKFAELIQDYDGLISVVQDQIDGINGGVVTGTVVTVESVLNYWKNEVATQEKSVEEAKQKVTAAEKSIELFNKGEYKEAYVIEQKKLALETAQEAYDVAKAIYDTALAQVKAVLETLSK